MPSDRAARAAAEAEAARRLAELDELEPYLELAREIRRDVLRVAADEEAGADSIAEVIERFPRDERERVARSVFAKLSPESQWAILADAFDDDDLRSFLALEHQAAADRARREGEHHALALRFRAAGEIDARQVPEGVTLTLGLFREPDVSTAVRKGAASMTCARRLVLRSAGGGTFRVVEDVFDPKRSFFVTREYDESTWRTERLDSHDLVEVGSIRGRGDDASLEPVLVPGARFDVAAEDVVTRGRLHLGFAMLGEDDVFAG